MIAIIWVRQELKLTNYDNPKTIDTFLVVLQLTYKTKSCYTSSYYNERPPVIITNLSFISVITIATQVFEAFITGDLRFKKKQTWATTIAAIE